jgi:hypothetical protein
MAKALTGPGPARSVRLRVVVLAAAGALVMAFLWGKPPETGVVEAAAASATTGGARVNLPAAATSTKIGFARRNLGAVAQNLFESHSWHRAPPPTEVAAPAAPPAPTAPPFPYSYFGKYERGGDKTVYFLMQGDRVYDVHVGDVLENTYSVDGAQNGQLRFTYLPLKIAQSMPIGDER